MISGNFGGLLVEDSGSDPTDTANNTIQGNPHRHECSGEPPRSGTPRLELEVLRASNTTIGGSAAGAGNVISGTTINASNTSISHLVNGAGVLIAWDALGTVFQGNKVGTDRAGTHALPNASTGVLVWLSATSVANNLISGNAGAGVYVYGNAVYAGFAGFWTADGVPNDGFLGAQTGTLVGGAGYATGLAGQAFSFDGTTGSAFVDGSNQRASYAIGANAGTSFSGWVKTTDADGTLMTDGGGIDTTNGTGLFVQGGKLTLIGSKGTAGQFNFSITGPTINDGQWHQFAYTWTNDTTVNGVKLYMDGVLVAQGTALASISGANPLEFGGDPEFHTLAYLNGLIDEVSVYRSVLAPSDIAAIFAQRAASQSAQAATITGNVIGTNLGGSAPLANGSGVVIDSSIGALVGGTSARPRSPRARRGPGQSNLISGNTGDGVLITGLATGNVVEGNLIGTNALGTAAIGNGNDGVDITSGASNNTIGGTTRQRAREATIDSNSGDGVASLASV